MQKQRSHMFVLLHRHLPGPSDDVYPNHFVFKQHPPTQQVLMHEKTCDPYICNNVCPFIILHEANNTNQVSKLVAYGILRKHGLILHLCGIFYIKAWFVVKRYDFIFIKCAAFPGHYLGTPLAPIQQKKYNAMLPV